MKEGLIPEIFLDVAATSGETVVLSPERHVQVNKEKLQYITIITAQTVLFYLGMCFTLACYFCVW